MTIAQAVAALVPESSMWQDVAKGLGTVLIGIVGFIGQRVLRAIDDMAKDLKKMYDQMHVWNSAHAATFAEQELRFVRLEDRLPDRRKPR